MHQAKCPLPNPTYSMGIWSWFAAHRPPTNKPTCEGLGPRDQEGLVLCKHFPICLPAGADDRKLRVFKQITERQKGSSWFPLPRNSSRSLLSLPSLADVSLRPAKPRVALQEGIPKNHFLTQAGLISLLACCPGTLLVPPSE